MKSAINPVVLSRSFSPVSIGHLRFIVMDCPSPATLAEYCNELKIRGVTRVVRLCEPTYDASYLLENGIAIHDLPYTDGGIPPPQVIQEFLQLSEQEFGGSLTLDRSIIESQKATIMERGPVIAVHCVAGLGRAPLMVAIVLIEAGLAPIDAVDFIRKCRRGAFNALQLKYIIDTYKRSSRTSRSNVMGGGAGGAFAGMFLKRTPTPPKPDTASTSSTSSVGGGGGGYIGAAGSAPSTTSNNGSSSATANTTNDASTADSFFKKMFKFRNSSGNVANGMPAAPVVPARVG